VCTYCGRPNPTSVDHVPPRSLFAKPRPSNLVTVPSREPCNVGASQDDEYFRLTIALRHDLDHPDANAAMDAAVRSLSRPEARGLWTDLMKSSREVELRTRGGLIVGRTSVYFPDVRRLCRVVERITRGLFFHETGRRLPNRYQVTAYLPPETDNASTAAALAPFQALAAALAGKPPRFVGKRVLSYRWGVAAEDANTSVWLLVFYGRVPFMCLTTPQQDIAAGTVDGGRPPMGR
jgi:hypothetical protein